MSAPDSSADARRWLRFADDDLNVAKALLAQSVFPHAVCYHAQQAAEKAIKAVLVLHGIAFPRTHDLELLQLLLPSDTKTKEAIDLPELSDWSVQSRYPTDADEPSPQDAERAVLLADSVLAKARTDFDPLKPRSSKMPEITAKMVNELRAKTGQGMMECKKALAEVGGDLEKAIEYFRKKGVKTSIQERAASEGRIVASEHGHVAAAVEVNCNTDFTAKSDAVGKLLELALHKQIANATADIRNDPEVKTAVTAIAQQTGENVQIGKAVALSNPAGHVGAYIYAITNKIAVLMSFSGNKPDAELMKDLGGHIAFARPMGLNRADVPADLVAKEKAIAVEQAKATGKPQEIAEKIAEGKMSAFYKERTLLDQDFFNPGKFKGSIQQMLKEKGTTLEKYVRVEVGQS